MTTAILKSIAHLDDYRWLVSADATEWLDLAAVRQAQATVRLAAELRHHLSLARAHLILEQVELRHRAARKFAVAASMFFAHRGLEQATDQFVAAYKASRFSPAVPVADLCCGIGGDLMALAGARPQRASIAIR